MQRIVWPCLIVIATACALDEPRGIAQPPTSKSIVTQKLASQARRPIALMHVGDQLFVANGRSGTLSVVDVVQGQVIAEHKVTQQISDAIATPNGAILLVDDVTNTLLRFQLAERKVMRSTLCDISHGGTKIAIDASSQRVYVSAKWARQVFLLDLDPGFEQVRRKRYVKLPLAPRGLISLNDSTLIVAEAFGGRLAVVDTKAGKVTRTVRINGHNIRGLAVSPDGMQLHIAQQQMVPRAKADYEELHWGRMLANGVQVVSINDLMSAKPNSVVKGWVDAVGGIGTAMGDPSGVVIKPEVSAVSFAGVGEIMLHASGTAKRIPVGEAPAAMAVIGDRLYVANRLDDTLSVVDIPRGSVAATISLGPQPEPTSVDRGERLFFDARLSHDGWMSCHSCHTDGHGSDLLVDTLGDGDYGAPKRVPSLLGTADTQPWGWTGASDSLEDQIKKSVETTMHGDGLSRQQTTDLAEFLKSLDPPPGVGGDTDAIVTRGRQVFHQAGCSECHRPPAYTSPSTFDVGISDEQDRKHFNPPSLKGVSQRSRFFHDGRAVQLSDVIHSQQHQLERPLNAKDAEALIAFLRSL